MSNRSDNFNRSNSSSVINSPSDGGADWVTPVGTWGIISSKGYKSATFGVWGIAYLEASSSSVDLQFAAYPWGSSEYLSAMLRYVDSSNRIIVEIESTFLKVFKMVAGTYTQLGSTYSGTISAGDVIKVSVGSSNVYTVYQNGTLRITTGADSAHSTSTKHGVTIYGTTPSFDDFSITDTAAGGSPVTLTTSLAAAIQAAKSATASMSAGVQAARTNTATTDAAVQAAQSAQASLNAAVSNITQAVASLGGAVLNSGATSASANAAVQLARNATTSLNLAVQAQGNATASISAQVQAGTSLSAALDGYVQSGSSISASASAAVLASALAQAGIAAAVQTPATTTAGLSAALRAAQQATAAIDAALQLARNATAGLSAQVQSGTSASVAIDAAIRATAQAVAGVDAAIARAGSASLSMGAAVALQRSISAAMAGALLSSRLSAVSANAYVFDPLSLIRVYASWQSSGRQEQLTATSRAGQVTSSRRPPQ